MAAVKALLRLFSVLFHALLALFLIVVSGLALLSGGGNLHLGMLPWTGSTLVYVLFLCALFGFAAVVLAVLGKWRALLLLWSLAVAVFMIKGYFLSGYRFVPGEASKAFWLSVAALAAVPGAWFQMWREQRRY